MRKLATILLLVALGVSLMACTSRSIPRAAFSDDGAYLPTLKGPGLVANDRSPIPDVPAPVGFAGVPSRSELIHPGAPARELRYVFQGRANPAEVVNFYRRNLPRHGWTSQGRMRDTDGSMLMRFTKDREALRVRIAERHSIITTTVTIGPRG